MMDVNLFLLIYFLSIRLFSFGNNTRLIQHFNANTLQKESRPPSPNNWRMNQRKTNPVPATSGPGIMHNPLDGTQMKGEAD